MIRHMLITFLRCLLFTLIYSSQSFASIVITDDLKKHEFEIQPKRVITLSWELTEQLIELSVPIIGASDIDGYHQWVAKPKVPTIVEDLGSRAEPNLEKIAQLKPDLILINDNQKPFINRLKKIAPVLYFKTFSIDHQNALKAISTFKKLGVFFNKEDVAEKKIFDMQRTFKDLSIKLKKAFHNKLPKVTSIRFASTSSVYIYGANSMSEYVLIQLGLEPALTLPSSQWGLHQKRLLELSKIQQGSVLYFEPFNQWDKLKSSRLWKAMPVVRNNHVAGVSPTWTYGGAISLKYLAENMTLSLLKIAENRKLNTKLFSAISLHLSF